MSKNWWDRNAKNGESFEFRSAKAFNKKVKQNSSKVVTEVFRYFDNEDHAAAFAMGEVFISTLQRCREYENPLQGDNEEGYERYNTGRSITGSGSDPAFVAMAARVGIHIGPEAEHVTLENNLRVSWLHDAYVLCTTLAGFKDNELKAFGKYCVKISDLEAFHNEITKALAAISNITNSLRGAITYKERFYKEFESRPGLVGFVKPPDKYSSQKEYRFLWHVPDGMSVSALVVYCPKIATMVTRIA